MSKKAPQVKTAPGEERSRFAKGETYRLAAFRLLQALQPGEDGTAALVLIQQAAIAYGDTLTMHFGGVKNQKDHDRLVDLVRTTMGERCDAELTSSLSTLLDSKTDIQYGIARGDDGRARTLMIKLKRLASRVADLTKCSLRPEPNLFNEAKAWVDPLGSAGGDAAQPPLP